MSAKSHEITVRQFCAAWDKLDLEGILALMSEDAIYHNMPLEPLVGKQQIADFVGGFFSISGSCCFEILNLTANDERVVTERLDSFGFLDGSALKELPVLGVFEFDADGKISAWREYWDLKTWVDLGGPAL